MKKVVLSIFLLTLIVIEVSAQLLTSNSIKSNDKYPFHKNEKAINLSVELLTTYNFTNTHTGVTKSTKSGSSIQLEYENGVADQLSLAGLFHYNDLTIEVPFSYLNLVNPTGIPDSTGISSFIYCALNPSSCIGSIRERVTVYTFGGKLKYHMSSNKKIDTYASVNFGYSTFKRQTTIDTLIQDFVNEETINIDIPKFSYSIGLGVRYFITSKIGLWGEVGFGKIKQLNLGVTYKFIEN